MSRPAPTPAPTLTLAHLRRYALTRSLFTPTTLPRAMARLGFVQADPIRAPARAQDLTLRHRVKDYGAGDLERRYADLDIEEDFFVNYGFLPRTTHRLMHPRTPRTAWPAERGAQAQAVLDFVRANGTVHPRQVDAAFAHGSATNGFGGASRASTQLLDGLHYRGLLRVARREGGVRLYAARQAQEAQQAPETQEAAGDPAAALDALIDVVVQVYAPLPARSLADLVRALRGGVPQWGGLLPSALARARQRQPSAAIDGTDWYWPAGEAPATRGRALPDAVRLLAPFDPVVWDRRRFERFWGWAYRFEAYTPAPQRVRGYYALPLLWREAVIGWGNLSMREGVLLADIGHVDAAPLRDPVYRAALDEELARMARFLGARDLSARVA